MNWFLCEGELRPENGIERQYEQYHFEVNQAKFINMKYEINSYGACSGWISMTEGANTTHCWLHP